ncbi:hypothetical protein GCM10020255_103240 [Rhodococcus baikonurensis]
MPLARVEQCRADAAPTRLPTGIGENTGIEFDQPTPRMMQSGNRRQYRRLACAVRSEDGGHLTGRDVERRDDIALRNLDIDVEATHNEPADPRPRTATTITTATTTSTSESATAASGSVSRWR